MIPKIIHICWLSGDLYPENIAKCIDSMKKNLPDYKINIWTKDNFDIESILWVKEAFESKKYAFAADYIRFWALYNFGGIYLDSDVEVLKTFDEMLKTKSFIGFEYLNIPEAAVVGAEKGCKWIKQCLDWYKDKHFINPDGSQNKQVVPHLVNIVLTKNLGNKISDTGKIQYFDDITIYPYFYFSPKNYFTGKIRIADETVCIHRFNSAWGPDKKRTLPLIIHNIVIHIIGKRNHDKLFHLVKPLPTTFNHH